MKTILLFGAGKSATSLIEYLGKCCDEHDWKLWVCDMDLALAQSKTKPFRNATPLSVNVANEDIRHELIKKSDVVISMLPAALHFLVARDCVGFSKNLLTASYVDPHIQALSDEIRSKGLLFICEMGLDPGIDHMSAMKIIHDIVAKGGKIISFRSHCGGLVAPESDDNPWHYKITWNPANVVAAGNAGARYLEDGNEVEIPYQKIFAEEEEQVSIPGLGSLAWYANRDSLSYIHTYDLHSIRTFIRTTLRYPAFIKGWNILVNAGFTNKNDFEQIGSCKTFREWFDNKMHSFEQSHPRLFQDSKDDKDFHGQIDFLGMRNDDAIPFKFSDSAAILQFLLEEKLVMQQDDKDMIVMLHEIKYELSGSTRERRSSLIVKGKDSRHTAMAQTVGLPLGITAKLILQNKIHLQGLYIPVIKEIYEPVLAELAEIGIAFMEKDY